MPIKVETSVVRSCWAVDESGISTWLETRADGSVWVVGESSPLSKGRLKLRSEWLLEDLPGLVVGLWVNAPKHEYMIRFVRRLIRNAKRYLAATGIARFRQREQRRDVRIVRC